VSNVFNSDFYMYMMCPCRESDWVGVGIWHNWNSERLHR